MQLLLVSPIQLSQVSWQAYQTASTLRKKPDGHVFSQLPCDVKFKVLMHLVQVDLSEHIYQLAVEHRSHVRVLMLV